MAKPVVNEVYTLDEIYKLDLRDSPSLCFMYQGLTGCIQDSHLSSENLLAIPGMKESKWKYIYETDEWIPIFQFDQTEDAADISKLVDLEVWVDVLNERNNSKMWWATPKGYPRSQSD